MYLDIFTLDHLVKQLRFKSKLASVVNTIRNYSQVASMCVDVIIPTTSEGYCDI